MIWMWQLCFIDMYKKYFFSKDEDVEQFDETIHLERGQNLFEIHVTKLVLSDDAIRVLGDEEPSLFCTWEFFEYEIQSTPVIRGRRWVLYGKHPGHNLPETWCFV